MRGACSWPGPNTGTIVLFHERYVCFASFVVWKVLFFFRRVNVNKPLCDCVSLAIKQAEKCTYFTKLLSKLNKRACQKDLA